MYRTALLYSIIWSGYGSRTQCLQDMNLTFKPFHSPAILLWRWGESNPRLDSNAIKSFTSLVDFFCNQQSQRFLIHSFYIVIKVCYFSDGSSDFVTTLSSIRNQGVMEALLTRRLRCSLYNCRLNNFTSLLALYVKNLPIETMTTPYFDKY